MKIKSITIEGMHTVNKKTYDLSNLSYLYGKNGAGKSTVLQAIQFALLGYIPGYNKTKEAIMQHSNGRVLEVKLKLTDASDNEYTVDRMMMNTGKSITSSLEVTPEGFALEDITRDIELPIFNFEEFKSMTANKLKDWFIQFLPNADASIDWRAELLNAVEDKNYSEKESIADEILETINAQTESGVESVRKVNTLLKDDLAFSKKSLERSQATIKSLIHYDDVDEMEDMDVIRQEINSLTALIDKIHEWEKAVATNSSILANIKDMEAECKAESAETDTEYISAKAYLEELLTKIDNTKLVEIKQKLSDLAAKKAEITADIKYANKQLSGGSTCPFTNEACETVTKYQDTFKQQIEAYTATLAEIDSEIATLSDERVKIESTNNQIQSEISAVQKKIQDIEFKYSYLAKLRTSLVNEPEKPTERSAEIIREDIQRYQDLLVKLAANKAYEDMLDKETKAKFAVELRIDLLKEWIKLTDANGLQTKLMDEPFMKLTDDMNKYLKVTLGNNASAHFNLSSKANSFSFGIMRDDAYIPFDLLSSGEKCLYTLALMMCIVSKSEGIKLILIDDLLDHLDEKNAEKLFTALYKVKDIQFIMAGVKECNIKEKDEVIISV